MDVKLSTLAKIELLEDELKADATKTIKDEKKLALAHDAIALAADLVIALFTLSASAEKLAEHAKTIAEKPSR